MAKYAVSHRRAFFGFVLVAFFVDKANGILLVKIVFVLIITPLAAGAGDQVYTQERQDTSTDKFAHAVRGC